MWREIREKDRESDYETEEEIDIQEEADLIRETLEDLERERDLAVININNTNINDREKERSERWNVLNSRLLLTISNVSFFPL